MKLDPRLLIKAKNFSEDDKKSFPIIVPDFRFPKEYSVIQNTFWALKHSTPPKDDIFRLLFLFSPKVRLLEGNVDEKTEFMITAKEYATFTSMKLDSAYTALSKAVDTLFQHSVIYFSEDKQRPIRIRLAVSCSYDNGAFYVTFSHFALFIMSVFSKDHPFTKLELKSAVSLSGHGLKLYPFFIQNAFRSSFDVPISDLKLLLGIAQESYTDFREFKKMVLKPHIDTINAKTELTVSFKAVKKEGRKASHVGFTISKKQDVKAEQPPKTTAKKEEPQPKGELDPKAQAIAFVMTTLSQRQLFERFRIGSENNMQVMKRIREEMEQGDYLHWETKLKEYTHSIPLVLGGIAQKP